MHAHSDLRTLVQPDHLAEISQGVTSEVLGQDGLSYAPVDDDALRRCASRSPAGTPTRRTSDWAWRTVGEYLDRLDGASPATPATWCHTAWSGRSLRVGRRAEPRRRIVAMQEIVRAAMPDGAVGLSAGLTYTPGMYADNDELIACARSPPRRRLFAPHQRSYGKGALDGYAEMIEISRRAGCRCTSPTRR